MPDSTRAAMLLGNDGDVTVDEISVPEPAAGQVRVSIAAAGLCHSDLGFVDGHISTERPVILGHEAVGHIVQAGDDVRTVRVGDRVVLNWAPACGRCWPCQHAQPWLCAEVEKTGAATHRGSTFAGEPALSALGVGAFAEEIVVPQECVVPIPLDVPIKAAAILGCGVLTGYGAVRRTADVAAGDAVAVVGLGGVGLSAVLGARAAGADTIIAIDREPTKEALAKAAGATHFLSSSPSLAKDVRALTGGRGADAVFECVGLGTTMREAWQLTRRGGQTVIVGVGRHDDTVSFSPLELFHFARSIKPSVYGSMEPHADVPALATAVARGELDLSPLVTHESGLDDIHSAIERMRNGIGARTVMILDSHVLDEETKEHTNDRGGA